MKKEQKIKAVLFVILALTSFYGYGQTVRKGLGGKPSSEAKANKLTLFPNPASTLVALNLTTKERKENFDLQIVNSAGSNIKEQKWNGEKIDVSAFQPGVYIVTLRKNRLAFSQKLVVARE